MSKLRQFLFELNTHDIDHKPWAVWFWAILIAIVTFLCGGLVFGMYYFLFRWIFK
jgi:hypothetical protein